MRANFAEVAQAERDERAAVLGAPTDKETAHLAEQAELIDLDLLRRSLVWYGCAPPVSQEELGWLVGCEVNRLLAAVMDGKDSAQGRRPHELGETSDLREVLLYAKRSLERDQQRLRGFFPGCEDERKADTERMLVNVDAALAKHAAGVKGGGNAQAK